MNKENNGLIEEFTVNSYGVTVKKCCASCKYHEAYDSNGPRRLCVYYKIAGKTTIVDKSYLCGHWSISQDIDRIRIPSCKPKKR